MTRSDKSRTNEPGRKYGERRLLAAERASNFAANSVPTVKYPFSLSSEEYPSSLSSEEGSSVSAARVAARAS